VRKYVPLEEFHAMGLVQEINRRILHPLGMALALNRHTPGDPTAEVVWSFGGIFDSRDDPEGIIFTGPLGLDDDLEENRLKVDEAMEARRSARVEGLGFFIQPIETDTQFALFQEIYAKSQENT
jgi:hypothetical protein